MNPERLRKSPSGRLLQVGQGDAAYWSFIPAPLPPALPWEAELVRRLSDADRALGELAGLGRTLPNPHLLIAPFIRREAVLSSRIEGTQTDLTDLYAYEAGQLPLFTGVKPSPPETDIKEVGNYVRAMEYGLERLHTLPVSLRFMRELHARLMEGVRGERATPGEFRRSQNWIGRPGCTILEAEFVPPPVPEMQEALDSFEKYLYAVDAYPPLIRLAFIHYQFETIHPFLDGNGRIGRLLSSLLLVSWDLLPLPLLYLSAFFEAHRQAYYDLLLAVSEKGAWSEWVRFFLEGVAEQARDAGARAKRLQDLQGEWRERLARNRSPGLLFRLADSLFEAPILTIPQARRLLEISYPSAKATVEKLKTAEILQQVGESPAGKIYAASEILKIIT
ncbi:MAG: Fic family protein [Deltaproteobacteria bacterium]|nr:MAG: Fic family protein [Deltaproteobacteria bacterium]